MKSSDKRHVMIDLETMGTTPGSAIAAIGAVFFNPIGTLPPLDQMAHDAKFYRSVDLGSCQRAGLTLDAATVQWWLQRPKDIVEAILHAPTHVSVALLAFRSFLMAGGQTADIVVWGHGAAFDPPLLEAAFRAADLPLPWEYRNIRDTRTLFDLAGGVKVDNDHHALRDAWNQARAVQAAIARVRVEPDAAPEAA